MKEITKAIRVARNASPFRLFFIELKSGTALVVIHPESIAIGKDDFALFQPDGEIAIFDADSVSQVRLHPPASRGKPATRSPRS
ncbi:MAG: hypothetical protein HY719_08970 [Planctomycetes bacterium]|nr:hypothetical protein [Planctomycetota bacterium]